MIEHSKAVLPVAFTRDSSRGDLERLRQLLPELGFKLTSAGSNWAIEERLASTNAPFLRLAPLTNWDSGRLRRDAGKHLVDAKWLANLSEVVDTSRLAIEHATIEGPLSVLERLQLELLLNPEPFPSLEEFLQHQPDVMLYRLIGTEKLTHRQTLWRSLTRAIEDGLSWSDQRTRQEIWGIGLSAGSPVGGFFPVQYVCAPMLARQQPIAMAFTTARGAQVVAVPKHGGWPAPRISPVGLQLVPQ